MADTLMNTADEVGIIVDLNKKVKWCVSYNLEGMEMISCRELRSIS